MGEPGSSSPRPVGHQRGHGNPDPDSNPEAWAKMLEWSAALSPNETIGKPCRSKS